MRVELAADVFCDDDFELIASLVRYFILGRHEWVVTNNLLPVIEEYTRRHAPQRAGAWCGFAEKSVVDQAWTAGPARDEVVAVTHESLGDHVDDLGLPARLVLENSEGDGSFVLAIAHTLQVERIIEAKKRGWLKFVQGGGSGEVPKVVRGEQADFKRVCRVMFLLDSDRMTPDEPSKHEAVAGELREAGVDGHILRFREVENYVPNRILAAARIPQPRDVPHSERIGHLRTLSGEQRAYFDMKKGFAGHGGKGYKIHPEQQEYYRSLPESARVGLRYGFGDGLMEVLLREAEAGKLKEADFDGLGPDVLAELRAILDLLQRIL